MDSAISFHMVLANGTTITASNNESTEIFWALRGGGDGTYGVVLNITYELYDNPGLLQVLAQVFPLDNSTGLPSLNVFNKWLSTASSNVSGSLGLRSIYTASSDVSWIVIYRGKYEDAVREFKPLMGLPSIYVRSYNYTDAYEYLVHGPADLGGVSEYTFSSFLQNKSLAMAESLDVAFQYVQLQTARPPHSESSRGCMGTILGGAVATAGRISGATAIHPGF